MSSSVVEPGRTALMTMRRPSSVVLICTMPDGSEKFETPAELITFWPPTARLISLVILFVRRGERSRRRRA